MAEDKEVTIYDIAERLKVSPATVSRGLQDHPGISKKTKKKIFDMAEQIGYRSNHFARNLRQKQYHQEFSIPVLSRSACKRPPQNHL